MSCDQSISVPLTLLFINQISSMFKSGIMSLSFFFFLICRFCKNLIKHIHSYASSFLVILHKMVHDLHTYIVIEKLCVHRMFNLIACISLYVLHAVSPLSLFHTVTTYVILLGSLKVSQACRLLQSFSYLIIHAVLRWS